jgi:hypothetical protein
MTGAAVIGGRWMLSRFTRCSNTVMATDAVGPNIGVAETGRRPGACAVAGITLSRGRHMGRRLALCGDAVMAAGAGTRRNAVVIENRA